jgi:hypothetical protein
VAPAESGESTSAEARSPAHATRSPRTRSDGEATTPLKRRQSGTQFVGIPSTVEVMH